MVSLAELAKLLEAAKRGESLDYEIVLHTREGR